MTELQKPDEAQVRLANMGDEESILRLTQLIHEEIGLYTFDPEKVRTVVHKALNHQLAMIGCIGEPNNIRACIYINIEPVWYSQDWQIAELWNFVHPEWRRHDYASRLIRWAKSISDDMRMNLFIGVLNNVRTEAKSRMYERLIPKAGAFFLYQPQSVGQ